MRVRIIGNVWVDGRALYVGEIADLSDRAAERLVMLGVAVGESAVACAAPSQAPRMESGQAARVPSVKAKPAGKKGSQKK